MQQFLKKISNTLFSTSAAGFYILVFAVAIAIATFIENDYGTSAAQKVVYKATWFEVLLVLFSICILVNIFRFRLIQQKKWATLTFHAAIIVIVIGAGVTRYFGYEGVMHIREGKSSNNFLSAESYIQFDIQHQDKEYKIDEQVLFASLGKNSLKKSYLLGSDQLDVELLNFVPNPTNSLAFDENGVPTLKIVVGGNSGREEYFLRKGENIIIQGNIFNFRSSEMPGAINIKFEEGMLLFKSDKEFEQTQMANQQRDFIASGKYNPLLLRTLYATENQNFVVSEFAPQAAAKLASSDRKMASSSPGAAALRFKLNNEEKDIVVIGRKGIPGKKESIQIGNSKISASYGAKTIEIPFYVKLHKFIMERYPGTESASSYASEVTLIDPNKNINMDYRIFMNNILDYGGYRFFQSSFDKDELGTYLSVNHDFAGTWISYIGYFLLTIGLILALFHKNSRFRKLSEQIHSHRIAKNAALSLSLILMMGAPLFGKADKGPLFEQNVIKKEHATKFGEILVQDHKGRMKPLNTLAKEVLRKLAKKEELYGLSSDQIFLAMTMFPEQWRDIPLIKMGKHEKLRKLIPVEGKLAAYSDFFNSSGQYLLREEVRRVYNLKPIDRGTLEKEIMKLDERINICSMIFSARLLRIYPIYKDENNKWISPYDVSKQHDHEHDNEHDNDTEVFFDQKFFPAYAAAVHQAMTKSDWALPDQFLTELDSYQHKYGGEVVPSRTKVLSELLLNKLNVFGRLGAVYGLLGMGFLALLFISIFNHELNLEWPFKIVFGLFLLSFFFQTSGLGLRWYVSGRAPWSNGYESMIYIAWTTTLAGLIFSKKSFGALAATNILAATILMVATLSSLDPEITPLVPVLKSYWLTIHVSLEAGSYGFLLLGAIIGALNLILMMFLTDSRKVKITRIVKEMTAISEMTLIGGLIMVSVGTYLGGIWANESWGRYWGWDAKETWALVTILVYAFILHMRFIPGLRGAYAFNLSSLFGWASVMMTYFGVNYYLSGLHSYAAGDPVPVPSFVYITVAVLAVISVLAYLKYRKYRT
jgi:cytochrome c-type biogenesis protein CcsB